MKYKKRYGKFFLLIMSLSLISTVYAICKVDVEVNSVIEIEKKPKLFDTVTNLAKEENACVTKYDGDVTDEVGKTVPATKVFFAKCENQRNVIFGGFCWQVIRTTETEGTKLLYNGEPVDGKCESTRPDHKGVISSNTRDKIETLNSDYLYGDSFAYDVESGTFTLKNTFNETWSDSTYDRLISKYTCKSSSDTCTTLYGINGYSSDTSALVTMYTIGDTEYAMAGTSWYNWYDTNKNISPGIIGYMYNKLYIIKTKSVSSGISYKYGNSFTYDEETNTYTLAGDKQLDMWISIYNKLSNTHYTCFTTGDTCQTLYYIIYAGKRTGGGTAYYIELKDGKSVEDALNEMLFDDNVNHYNSIVKGIVDNWYMNNLIDYTNKLENAVYCSSREIDSLRSWNPNGGAPHSSSSLRFKNSSDANYKDLSCAYITDQFAVNNNRANLEYPVALLTREEQQNINDNLLLRVRNSYWLLSPSSVGEFFVYPNEIYGSDTTSYSAPGGIRPVITVYNKTYITSGTGSEIDPWIIK